MLDLKNMGFLQSKVLAMRSSIQAVLQRNAKRTLNQIIFLVRTAPLLKVPAKYLLQYFPKTRERLRRYANVERMKQKQAISFHFKEVKKVQSSPIELLNISNLLSEVGTIYYCVDNTARFPKNTGIERVVRQLASALIELGVALIPIRLDPNQGWLVPVSGKDLHHLAKWNGPAPDTWAPWKDPQEIKKGTGENAWLILLEVIHSLGEEGALQLQQFAEAHGIKTMGVYYDSAPLTLPSIYDPHFAMLHHEYMLGLSHFDLILAISEFSANEAREYFAGTLPSYPNLYEKVHACVLPSEFLDSPRITQIREKKDGVVRMLCVGTAHRRKNHETLLRAFDIVCQQSSRSLELIFVGNPYHSDINQLISIHIQENPRIRWEQDADDARLCELYMECDFTIYPSLSEGFGLPILESLWHALPCICRNEGALAEAAVGGGCLTVDTTDVNALADAILQLSENDRLRRELAIQATQRHFKSWREYAMETIFYLSKSSIEERSNLEIKKLDSVPS